jgi:hypothetical protein
VTSFWTHHLLVRVGRMADVVASLNGSSEKRRRVEVTDSPSRPVRFPSPLPSNAQVLVLMCHINGPELPGTLFGMCIWSCGKHAFLWLLTRGVRLASQIDVDRLARHVVGASPFYPRLWPWCSSCTDKNVCAQKFTSRIWRAFCIPHRCHRGRSTMSGWHALRSC